jgi:MFS family permease
MTSVIYTTMYTSGIEGMQEAFDISSEIVVLLGLTTNLFGLAIGSVVLSSLSEIYGRRPVYLVSVLLFGILILPVALAQKIEAVLISRFFGGFFGGVMISSAPGSVTDVTDDRYRALALSCWSLGTMNGPVLGTTSLALFPVCCLVQYLTPSARSHCWGVCLPISGLAMD